ncbi:hypothetical protein DSO57_1010070 [Entomophthora muscae]|uniref:Uncharacterized protein n=1 Tax=Entomophthora muscae TaxID=34485 RepID=A0ACC2SJI5_9FUNG|nr:hypothetical protein DSO57_1010070 [Entomophthora muscae]
MSLEPHSPRPSREKRSNPELPNPRRDTGRESTFRRWGSNTSSRHPTARRTRSKIVNNDRVGPWTIFSWMVTCCFPPFLLRCFGMENRMVQQAWREKIALVFIIIVLCSSLGFLTFVLQQVLCGETSTARVRYKQLTANQVAINGNVYDISNFVHPPASFDRSSYSEGFMLQQKPFPDAGSKDLSFLFQSLTRKNPGSCRGVLTVEPEGDDERYFPCVAIDYYSSARIQGSVTAPACHFGLKPSGTQFKRLGDMYFTWNDVSNTANQLVVYGGNVLDLSRLDLLMGDVSLVQEVLDLRDPSKPYLGRDASYFLSNEYPEVGRCLKELLRVGMIDTNTVGCITTQVIQYISLVVIIGVVLSKFVMAVVFGWVLSWRLGALNERTYKQRLQRIEEFEAWVEEDTASSSESDPSTYNQTIHRSEILGEIDPTLGFALHHTIQLVTCYSEGLSSIRTTLDSLASTNYPKNRQLLFVIADGIITGAENDTTTPDLCLSLMSDLAIPPERVRPHSYVAIAEGSRRHNMAKVFAGYYRAPRGNKARVPMVLVVKCGTPEEAITSKPGNRGKRDSQVLLMSFLQKAMFDERMTELEYEIFNAVWMVAGVTPDVYESVLMVDADTAVYPDALTRMVACFSRDPKVMGLCGETKIANKSQSWVTMIQVFEYYISHHLSKAFESIFGGVTCLPGCFCMYRIKAPKGSGDWVPVLCNPDILQQYSENVVTTLHQKNLLLLGEDRYLTTLMLRTFPKRKLIFVPQAVCKTIVPDTFGVLLSQRRRWINSTIHNLLELVITRDLCGTFCFSMQFIVFMELLGTVVLPAAISFTIYLLVITATTSSVPVIPLVLLGLILGLPAILIVMTTRKVSYLVWMLIYLASLPIWNFVLPVYAFWHFDDFSWGQTRMIAGGDSGHAHVDGEFKATSIIMKRWKEFEREKRRRTVTMLGNAGPDAGLPTAIVNDPGRFGNAMQSSFIQPHPNMPHLDDLGYMSPLALRRVSRAMAAEEEISFILTDTQTNPLRSQSVVISDTARTLPWRSQNSLNPSRLSLNPSGTSLNPSRLSLNPNHTRTSIFDPNYSQSQK